MSISFLVPLLLAAQLGSAPVNSNPAAEGFDIEGSDPAAIALADQIMEAMGGRAAYDATRYVSWTFFGNRQHYWDRYTGDVRIEGDFKVGEEEKRFLVLMNIHDQSGRAWVDGVEVTEAEALKKLLERGYGWWINDSYWVFMPYKLKDTGVTLSYEGQRELEGYGSVLTLGLRFNAVGLTPWNRYEVFVDPDTHLVCAWSFYAQADATEAGFTIPWADWQKVGRILLAGSHGRDLDWALRAYEQLPETVFTHEGHINLD